MSRSNKESVHSDDRVSLKSRFSNNNLWRARVLGFSAGVILILAVRFINYKPMEHVHYHANFAIYINGQREKFTGPIYYQETVACAQEEKLTPEERVHMHDNVDNVLHIHDHAVTWGDFFSNLGGYVGANFLETQGKQYTGNKSQTLSIILNGQDLTGITTIANKVIGDRDRLLVSYGNDDSARLKTEYNSVASTAKKYDESKDPASCGAHAAPTFKTRLNNLL